LNESTGAAVAELDILSKSMCLPGRTLSNVLLSFVSGRFDMEYFLSIAVLKRAHWSSAIISTADASSAQSARNPMEPRHYGRPYKRKKTELDSSAYYESPSKAWVDALDASWSHRDESQEASERQRKRCKVSFAKTDLICKFEKDFPPGSQWQGRHNWTSC
jgi:hypothetical protein